MILGKAVLNAAEDPQRSHVLPAAWHFAAISDFETSFVCCELCITSRYNKGL